MSANHQMIFCIVNSGFSELVMKAATEAGARGGTVIHGRGTASRDAEEFFHLAIQPDKEIVMILVPRELTDGVLTAVNESVGLGTPGQGIAFSMPVTRVIGLS